MNLRQSKLYTEDLETTLAHAVDIEKLYGKKVLITGATGTIGSFAADALIHLNQKEKANIRVLLAGRSVEKLQNQFGNHDNVKYLSYDLNAPIEFDEDIDYVIHAAGNAHPAAFNGDPVGTIVGNVDSTYRLLEYAKKLTKYDENGNVTVAGFALRYSGEGQGVADKNLTILHAFGGRMFDPETRKASGVVNSPESVAGLTWIKKCLDEKVTSLEIGVPETAFSQGRAAMMLRESWVSGWLDESAPDINYMIYPAPAQKEAIGGGNLFPWCNLVYNGSPNKELAWRFLEFLMTPENDLEQNERQGLLPVMEASYDSEYVENRKDFDSVQEVVSRGPGPAYDYYIPEMNELASVFGTAVQNVMYGYDEPQSALDKAAVEMDKILGN